MGNPEPEPVDALFVGLTDAGEVALHVPGSPPLYLTPDDARHMARALVAGALDGDRIRAAAN
jgi:hypothetical protein